MLMIRSDLAHLTCGVAPCTLHECLAQAKVWLQWQRWLLSHKLKSKKVVVLNMDETSMLSPIEKRRGFFTRKHLVPPAGKQFKRRGQRRCTLIAVISSDDALQKKLPQILLPRNPQKRKPGARLRRVYANMGAPIEAWHGTCGSVDRPVLKMWLRRIKKMRPAACGRCRYCADDGLLSRAQM